MKDLCNENYKILTNELKKIQTCEQISHVHGSEKLVLLNVYTTQSRLRISTVLSKFQRYFLQR